MVMAHGAARPARPSGDRRGGAVPTSIPSRAGSVPRSRISATPRCTIHHTAADTVERIAPEELSKATAAIAAITYVAATPDRIPR
jgi:hypothetical protein